MNTLLTVVVPVRLVSEANRASHEFWRVRQRRVKAQREAVTWALAGAWGPHEPPAAPLNVHITRIAPRTLDDDNLASSGKGTRDAVAKWLGIDDKRRDLCAYSYAQEKGKPHEYAVRIEIARRGSE